MTTPGGGNSSGLARLMQGAIGFQVGWQQPVYVQSPAAGASWSHKVDGRYWERLLSVYYVYTASAVVANRTSQLNLVDQNGAVVLVVGAGATVTAGQTKFCSLQIGNPTVEGGIPSGAVGWLPDFLVPMDWSWQLAVANEDAGDTVTGIVLLVQQFPNDAAVTAAD